MSRENVEPIQPAIDAFNRRDIDVYLARSHPAVVGIAPLPTRPSPRDTGRPMSRENVQVVERLFDAINRANVDAFVETFAVDAAYMEPPDVPGASVLHGHVELRRFFEGLGRLWTHFHVETDDLIPIGDQVLAMGRANGQGRTSGVEVVRPFQLVVTVRDGLVQDARYYSDRAEALEAVGLRE